VRTISSPGEIALLRLRAAIDSEVADPHLQPEAAAAAAGMSLRHANVLLAPEGKSVADYIAERRLECCRRGLEDPARAALSVAEIAISCGFRDLYCFGRRFKAQFGFSPSDYRRQLR
jgi:AraC-like DNA-binding protein